MRKECLLETDTERLRCAPNRETQVARVLSTYGGINELSKTTWSCTQFSHVYDSARLFSSKVKCLLDRHLNPVFIEKRINIATAATPISY